VGIRTSFAFLSGAASTLRGQQYRIRLDAARCYLQGGSAGRISPLPTALVRGGRDAARGTFLDRHVGGFSWVAEVGVVGSRHTAGMESFESELRLGPVERCGQCAAEDIVPLVFGYPGPQMQEADRRGEIVSGGCMEMPPPVKGAKAYGCRRCDRWYWEIDGVFVPMEDFPD
jgi:hypothetical protein